MRAASRKSTGFAVLGRAANEGGYFRPIVKEVVERYLDCGNQKCQRGETRSETSEIPEFSESKRWISDLTEVSDVI